MELHNAIYERRAIRDYLDSTLEHTVIERLIDAAIQAPTALNQQPWIFTVVRNQHILEELSTQAKTYMLSQHSELAHSDRFRMLNDPHFQIFYRAPVLILISAAATVPWCVEDCALAAQNLMLAAYAEGLGSCWIGFAQGYLNTSAGKALLRLPAGCAAVAPIIVGAARGVVQHVPRKAPNVSWVD